METFYIILALYFALIFIHGAYMAGKEIGREEALSPKNLEIKLTVDAHSALGKIKALQLLINNLPVDEEKLKRYSPFPPGSSFSFGYPFKFEAGGKIE